MSDCKITSLSEEVIAIILSYNDITIEDIINFRCVCKQFRYAAKYDKFLEKKLSQRWPYAKKRFEFLKKRMDGENINFVTIGINSTIQLRNYLSEILFYDYYYNNRSNKNYFNVSIDNLMGLDNAMKFIDNVDNNVNSQFENERLSFKLFVMTITKLIKVEYIFYIDEIKYMFTQSPRGIDRNSIERYYNIKRSHYVKLSLIRNELDRYKEKPVKEQFLEETCIFMAQRIQLRKDVCYTKISASLDTIAQEVLNFLRGKHPNHSIFSTSDETFSYWKTNNIEDNQWDETECTQIMDTLQEYIFGTLNFRPCRYSRRIDIKCFCIDYVLQSKYGQDIIIFAIFQSVARRLGLRCDIIVIWPHYCIFWKPKFVTNNLENARCFYIKDENFPNCLSDYLPTYMFCKLRLLDTAIITTKEMLLILKNVLGKFIINHELKDLKVVDVKCNINRTWSVNCII